MLFHKWYSRWMFLIHTEIGQDNSSIPLFQVTFILDYSFDLTGGPSVCLPDSEMTNKETNI